MNFQEMRDVDIRTVDLSTLVDIEDVTQDMALPPAERQADFVRRVKNPYCFRLGKVAVKIGFADTGRSIEDCLERYLLSL